MSFIDENNPDAINHREWNWRFVNSDSAAPFAGPPNLLVVGTGPGAAGNPYTVIYSADGDNPFLGGGIAVPPGPPPPPYVIGNIARGRESYVAQFGAGFVQSLNGGVTWNVLAPAGGWIAQEYAYDSLNGTFNGENRDYGWLNTLIWNPLHRSYISVNNGSGCTIIRENGVSRTVTVGTRPLFQFGLGNNFFFDHATGNTFFLNYGTGAADGSILRSRDLVNWTTIVVLSGDPTAFFSGMGRAGGFLFLTVEGASGLCLRSADNGDTWSGVLNDPSTNFFRSIFASEDGNIAVFRGSHSYWHSANFGNTWAFIGDLPAPVGYGAGSPVAGGVWREDLTPAFWLTMQLGPVYSSTDLLTWTERGKPPDATVSPWTGLA